MGKTIKFKKKKKKMLFPRHYNNLKITISITFFSPAKWHTKKRTSAMLRASKLKT